MLFELLLKLLGVEVHITVKRVEQPRHTSADEQQPEHPDVSAMKQFVTEMDNGHHGGNKRSRRNGR